MQIANPGCDASSSQGSGNCWVIQLLSSVVSSISSGFLVIFSYFLLKNPSCKRWCTLPPVAYFLWGWDPTSWWLFLKPSGNDGAPEEASVRSTDLTSAPPQGESYPELNCTELYFQGPLTYTWSWTNIQGSDEGKVEKKGPGPRR